MKISGKSLLQYTMEVFQESELRECRKSHGDLWNSDSDSDFELTKNDFDKLYKDFEPPPIKIDPTKHKIITLNDNVKDTEQDQKILSSQQALLSNIMQPAICRNASINGAVPNMQADPKIKENKRVQTQKPTITHEETLSNYDSIFPALGTTKRKTSINNEKVIFKQNSDSGLKDSNEKTTNGKKRKKQKKLTSGPLSKNDSSQLDQNILFTNEKNITDTVLTETSRNKQEKTSATYTDLDKTPDAISYNELQKKFLDLNITDFYSLDLNRSNVAINKEVLLEEDNVIDFGTTTGSNSEEVEKTFLKSNNTQLSSFDINIIANEEVNVDKNKPDNLVIASKNTKRKKRKKQKDSPTVLTTIITDLGTAVVANYDELKKKLVDYNITDFPSLETNVNSHETNCLQDVPGEKDSFLSEEQNLKNQAVNSKVIDTSATTIVGNSGEHLEASRTHIPLLDTNMREKAIFGENNTDVVVKDTKKEQKSDQTPITTDIGTTTFASQDYLLKVAQDSTLFLSKELVAEIQRNSLNKSKKRRKVRYRSIKQKLKQIYSVKCAFDCFDKVFSSNLESCSNADLNMIQEIENYDGNESKKKLFLSYRGSQDISNYNMSFSTGYNSCLYQCNYFDLLDYFTDLKMEFQALSVDNAERIFLISKVQSQLHLYPNITEGLTQDTKYVYDEFDGRGFQNWYQNEMLSKNEDYENDRSSISKEKNEESSEIQAMQVNDLSVSNADKVENDKPSQMSIIQSDLKIFFSDFYIGSKFIIGMIFLRYFLPWFLISVIQVIDESFDFILLLFLLLFLCVQFVTKY